MKKLVLLCAVAAMTASVSAQTVTESKTFDNVYIGVNGGISTKATGYKWMDGLTGNAGLRIGRWFTPVFGLAVESNAYFSNRPFGTNHTLVRFLNTSLLGTINFSNWFGRYPGEPRSFEVVGVYGLGWGHVFGNPYREMNTAAGTVKVPSIANRNNVTSKAGLDFVFNLGKDKAWQFYVEPAVIWGLNDANGKVNGDYYATIGKSGVEYNLNRAFVQLNAGFIYKFKNSNGTHNFTVAKLYDQEEIDRLNGIINDLRNRPVQEKIVEKVVTKEVPVGKEVKVENLVFVTFAQGKSALTKEAKKALDAVNSGARVQIVGTASPEGNAALNQKLSQNRANAVAEYLKGRGVIVDEAVGKGVQGTTSNRLAIVYVK